MADYKQGYEQGEDFSDYHGTLKEGKAVSVWRLTAFGKEVVDTLDKLVRKAKVEGIDLQDPKVMEYYLSLTGAWRNQDGKA